MSKVINIIAFFQLRAGYPWKAAKCLGTIVEGVISQSTVDGVHSRHGPQRDAFDLVFNMRMWVACRLDTTRRVVTALLPCLRGSHRCCSRALRNLFPITLVILKHMRWYEIRWHTFVRGARLISTRLSTEGSRSWPGK